MPDSEKLDSENQRSHVRVAIVQTKPRKGQYSENLRIVSEAFAQLAQDEQPDLVVLPEAALTGYFLEGAVFELALPAQDFAHDLARTWRQSAGDRPVDIACGFFENDGGTFYNSAIYLRVHSQGDGRARGDSAENPGYTIAHVHRKLFLPTYGVFDEERFLSRGRSLQVFETHFGRAAMLICEDMWHAIVPTIAAIKGARVLIVPSAAPGRGIEGETELTSITRWRDILSATASEHGIYVMYAGLTGFEGGKGMTGSSCVVDPHGHIVVQAGTTESCIIRADLDTREIDVARANLPLLGDLSSVLPDLLRDAELRDAE